MDKLKIDEVYILCTKTISDGRIGKFFADRGVLKTYSGTSTGIYYHSDGVCLYPTMTVPKGKTRINPWKKPRRKFPREMMVSLDGIDWRKRTVVVKTKTFYPYIAIADVNKIDDKKAISLLSWKYAKEIDDRTAS